MSMWLKDNLVTQFCLVVDGCSKLRHTLKMSAEHLQGLSYSCSWIFSCLFDYSAADLQCWERTSKKLTEDLPFYQETNPKEES